MPRIFHSDLAPLAAPSEPYSPGPDVTAWRVTRDGAIIQELFLRGGGSFGFRYRAWVNFADAGGGPHHLWHEYHPSPENISDSADTAKSEAIAHARDTDADFGSWSDEPI
jgi:hypothetical protein